MKRAVLYSDNNEAKTVLDYQDQLCEYQITAVAGLRENEAALQAMAAKYNVNTTSDFRQALWDADAVVFCDDAGGTALKSYADKIMIATERGKETVVGYPLLKKLSDLGQQLPGKELFCEQYLAADCYREDVLLGIDVPLVSVLGMGENCNKFDVQIKLREALRNKGYNVLSLCSNPLGRLFGMYNLPDFLYDDKRSIVQKSISFNHMLYELAAETKPDVIVLGYPSGVMPLCDWHNYYFAEIPTVLANATQSDLGIFCTFFWPQYTPGFFSELKNLCQYKFNIPLQSFCICGQQYYIDDEMKLVQYRFFDEDYVDAHFPSLTGIDCSVINLTKPAQIEKMVDSIINELTGNVDVL